jgi:hypothetical protein
MEFSKEQLKLINSDNPKVSICLENETIYAIFSLGQMIDKIARLTLSNGRILVGIFKIEELNGESNLDFSDPNDWTNIELNSIKVSITSPDVDDDTVVYSKETVFGLSRIEKIELLEN